MSGPQTDRDFATGAPKDAACGFGYLAFAGLASQAAACRAGTRSRRGRRTSPPRAKRVIFLFMHGGPSQVDTFDYKPASGSTRASRRPS